MSSSQARFESEHVTTEHVIESVGHFSWYQMFICSTILFTSVPFIFGMYMMTLGGYVPTWNCEDILPSNVTQMEASKNCTLFINRSCGIVFDSSTVSIANEWELVCDRSWIIYFTISLQMAGVLVGSTAAGYCADQYGRKKTYYLTLVLYIVISVITVFSVSWIMFAVCRFAIGIFVGSNLSVALNYALEFVGRRSRSMIIAEPQWPLGTILVGISIWLFPNWKHYHIICSVLCVPAAIGWCFVPESIRWLTVKGRVEEAKVIVTNIAKKEKKPIPDMHILHLIAEEEKISGLNNSRYGYMDLFKRSEYRRKTLLLCSIWFFISCSFYGLLFSASNLHGNLGVNIILMGCAEIPKPFLTIIIAKRCGRRLSGTSLYIFSVAASIGAIAISILGNGNGRTYGVLVCFLMNRLCLLMAWGFLCASTAEQFPTVVRNLAFGACNSSARLGGILCSLILYYSIRKDYVIYIVTMVFVLICIICSLCLPETKMVAMEDTFETKVNMEKNRNFEHGSLLQNDQDLNENLKNN